jgi:hypothetical protein
MEDFRAFIDSASSGIFQTRKFICDTQSSAEVVKKSWKEFESASNMLPNDLNQVIDRLFMMDFRDLKIISKHVDEITRMFNTLRPDDTVRIKKLQSIYNETQRLCVKVGIVSKMALTAVRESELALHKELIMKYERENKK